MSNALYSRLIGILTLAELLYLDDLDMLVEPQDHDDIILLRDLMQNYSPEDVHFIIAEFMYWYKHNRNSNRKEE